MIQLAAILAGLVDWLGFYWLVAAPVAATLGYIPFVGSVLGMAGAMKVWHWEWWQAGLLFFGGIALSIAAGGFADLTAMAGNILGRRAALGSTP